MIYSLREGEKAMTINKQHPAKDRNTSSRPGQGASVLLAIPVFNEFKYVSDVLDAVREYSDNILVVDDGSTDGTSDVVTRHGYVHLIRHPMNMGYGQSLIDAFGFAHQSEFEWVITMDCDHQHEPSCIPPFYSEIEKDDADIVSGSRYLSATKSGPLEPPADRVAINKKITGMLNKVLAFRLTDAFCGFKAYRVRAVSRLDLTETGYGFPLQLWIKANEARLTVHEIPVPLIYRDPKRSFSGNLNDPQIRIRYYVETIERELGHDVGKDITKYVYS
jgi:dolichol-phosphate mannosyltransferase